MLLKPNRLPAPAFATVFRAGKRIHHPLFQLIVAKNTLPYSRFAFVVGTKIDKRAVGRNRMKRLARESIRHLLPTIKPGIDSIIVVKQNFADKKQKEIEKEIQKLLLQHNLL